jgi:hypothetical protein
MTTTQKTGPPKRDSTIELSVYEDDTPSTELELSEGEKIECVQDFEDKNKTVWKQRIKYLLTTLVAIFSLISLVRAIGGVILIQLLLGRYFLWIPISLELLLNLFFSFFCMILHFYAVLFPSKEILAVTYLCTSCQLVQSDYPVKNKFRLCRIIGCIYLCINAIGNVIVIALVVNIVKGFVLTISRVHMTLFCHQYSAILLSVCFCVN